MKDINLPPLKIEPRPDDFRDLPDIEVDGVIFYCDIYLNIDGRYSYLYHTFYNEKWHTLFNDNDATQFIRKIKLEKVNFLSTS